MLVHLLWRSHPMRQVLSVAARLSPAARKATFIKMLLGAEPVKYLADKHQVSQK